MLYGISYLIIVCDGGAAAAGVRMDDDLVQFQCTHLPSIIINLLVSLVLDIS